MSAPAPCVIVTPGYTKLFCRPHWLVITLAGILLFVAPRYRTLMPLKRRRCHVN